MAQPETAFFRGEGGAVFAMDLPLPEHMQEKLTKGYLTRVNADGSAWVEPPSPEPAASPADAAPAPAEPGPAVPVPVAPRPAASKAEWVGYAVRAHGMKPDDAEAMTKQDLIDRFGRDQPAGAADTSAGGPGAGPEITKGAERP